MCKLCETPAIMDRLNRVIRALDGGGNFKPDAVRELLSDARDHMGVLFRAHLAAKLTLTLTPEEVAAALASSTEAPPRSGLH